MTEDSPAAAAVAALVAGLSVAEEAHADADIVDVRFVGGHRVTLRVSQVATATVAQARDIDRDRMIVADRVPAAVRAAYAEAGVSWWDRRGHLRIQNGPVLIDTHVPPEPRAPVSSVVDPLGGAVVAGIAFAALQIYPEPLPGVRELARRIDASPGGVSLAIRRLTDAGLLTVEGVAAHPGLFWSVTDHWRPAWSTLEGVPAPTPGLVAVGSLAAAQLGAPIAVTDSGTAELLAADQATYRAAARSATGRGTARIAVAPTTVACWHHGTADVAGHACAHPVVVAVLLGADPARGAEIIDDWKLADRAW